MSDSLVLSIIIVNFRSWDCLERCLERLLEEGRDESWEIIVVDNQSADGVLDGFSRRFGHVVFHEAPRNGGFAYGCNLGAGLARGDALLFLNPDTVPEAGSVQSLLQLKEAHPDIAILSAGQVDARGQWRKVFDVFPHTLTWFRTSKFLFRLLAPKRFPNPRRAFEGLRDCDWVSGSVFMISRDTFEQLGRWREDFWMYVEDCDFCFRARQAGLRVALAGDIRMMHAHGGATRQNDAIAVLTRTEAAISKHVYVHLNHHGLDRSINHLCVFLAVVPKLVLMALLDGLTLRQVRTLRTRSGVLFGLISHYAHVVRSGDWRSRQVSGEAA